VTIPTRLPPHEPGQSIGLLGGSFNPPHSGHRAASLIALRRLKLDYVWWLVSPGNPLKDPRDLQPLPARLTAARKVARHPRIVVTGLEGDIGTPYTVETLDFLKRRCRGVRFVWLMGADSLFAFHRWKHWHRIIDLVPIAVIDRPGATLKAMHSPAGEVLARFRRQEAQASTLSSSAPPAFTYLHGPRSSLSSTELRAMREPRQV
jgi:nicotinate-nucleotide adenylyltransferase